MTVFFFSIPLMVLAVALTVLPLILMSRADHRQRTLEVDSQPWPTRPRDTADDDSVPLAA